LVIRDLLDLLGADREELVALADALDLLAVVGEVRRVGLADRLLARLALAAGRRHLDLPLDLDLTALVVSSTSMRLIGRPAWLAVSSVTSLLLARAAQRHGQRDVLTLQRQRADRRSHALPPGR
jgi:hypothetical protein